MTSVALIAAVAREAGGLGAPGNGRLVSPESRQVIGAGNALPWPKISEDLKRFKALTLGHPVIMGRKTYDSIGSPLPGRPNIVVTRDAALKISGCHMANSLDAAISAARNLDDSQIFVIGGEQIYRQAISAADAMYITEIGMETEGDAHFPEFDAKVAWREAARERHDLDVGGSRCGCHFVTYRRQTS